MKALILASIAVLSLPALGQTPKKPTPKPATAKADPSQTPIPFVPPTAASVTLPPKMSHEQALQLENLSLKVAMIFNQVQGQIRPLIDQRSSLIAEVLKENPGWQWDQQKETFTPPVQAPVKSVAPPPSPVPNPAAQN